jgi:hypothetical protein
MARAFAKPASKKLPVGELDRDGTGVGFCDATSGVIPAHPFEALSRPCVELTKAILVTTESNHGG